MLLSAYVVSATETELMLVGRRVQNREVLSAAARDWLHGGPDSKHGSVIPTPIVNRHVASAQFEN